MKNRNLITLLSGQFISTFGNNLLSIALPWFVYTMTHSKADLAYVGIAQSLPALLGMVAGVFVDRWSKRQTMIVSDVIRMAICLVLGAWSLLHPSLIPIVLLVFILQCVGAFFNPAAGALLPLIVPKENVPAAMGYEQSGTATAQLVGTLSGGVLLTLLSAPLLFFSDGISFLLSAISLLFIRIKEKYVQRTIHSEPPSFRREFLSGLAMFRKSRFLILSLVGVLIANFAFAPLDLALTAWVKGNLGGSASALGMINAAFFLGMIIGGVLLGRISKIISLRMLFLWSLAIAGALVICIGLLPNVLWDALITLCIGFVVGTLNGGFGAVATGCIPEELRARAWGTIGSLSALTVPIGMVVGGIWMTHLALANVFLVVGCLSIVASLPFLLPVKQDLQAIGVAS
ncbi:MFS transporter [Alicyclobacillus dauci]|uniref:MFS transporter n=1 Tax=Alicyclobacillus dauci TaxID=1475485 RepID=A0ABY6Z685_9BACL|nr:MFS transporter [Alicyclobacillus dauci]WAH37784.1 MFS transporter [Alicyclobacillus dauci]